MCNRPTPNELKKKIKIGKAAIANGKCYFSNVTKATDEIYDELELDDAEDVWPLISDLLCEICPNDYSGARPPLQSYERKIQGHELFAFSWESNKLGERMYLKFAIVRNCYYYVSLHRDRPEKKDSYKKL